MFWPVRRRAPRLEIQKLEQRVRDAQVYAVFQLRMEAPHDHIKKPVNAVNSKGNGRAV
jgi:hypothetical protein